MSSPIQAPLPHALQPDRIDDTQDEAVNVPFQIDEETFSVPPRCADEVDSPFSRGLWLPGRPLNIAYVTWNMAQSRPSAQEVSDFCIRPNAHLIAVTTQENGPYVGLNTAHRDWEHLVERVCLQHKYKRVASRTLWAIHLAVYAREHDVARYVREVDVGIRKTGSLKGVLGNKGGVGISLTMSLRESTMLKALGTGPMASRDEDGPVSELTRLASSMIEGKSSAADDGDGAAAPPLFSPTEEVGAGVGVPIAAPAQGARDAHRIEKLTSSLKKANPDSKYPHELTLLFIGTHLTAHQHNVDARNEDYHNIVHDMPVGTRGMYRTKFLRSIRSPVAPHADDPSAAKTSPMFDLEYNNAARNVTNEFDFCFFGGDLNYRLNGTWRSIEFIINHRKSLRSVLIHNDQLIKVMKQGLVFHGFTEGELHFRPTYKYDVVGGVTQDAYAFSHSNPRMPSYCDRLLVKVRKQTEPFHKMKQLLYTDCPDVRTSDHRPVVGIWEVETTLILDGPDGDDAPAEPFSSRGACSCVA